MQHNKMFFLNCKVVIQSFYSFFLYLIKTVVMLSLSRIKAVKMKKTLPSLRSPLKARQTPLSNSKSVKVSKNLIDF